MVVVVGEQVPCVWHMQASSVVVHPVPSCTPQQLQVDDFSRLTLQQALRQDNPSRISHRVASAIEAGTSSLANYITATQAHAGVAKRFNRTVLVQEARARFLGVLRSLFTEMYNAGKMKSHGLFRLLENVDASLDAPERPIALWPGITPHLAAQRWMHASVRALSTLRVPWRATSWVVGRGVRDSVQIAVAVVHANQEAMQLMRRYDVGDLWQGGEDLYFDAEMDRLLQLLRDNVIDQVAAESAVDVKAAQSYLAAVRLAFPQVVMDVQTHHAATALLHHKAAFVGELHRAGRRSAWRGIHECLIHHQQPSLHTTTTMCFSQLSRVARGEGV